MSNNNNHSKPSRQDLFEELRAQIRKVRQGIDPEVLQEARQAITGEQASGEDNTPEGHEKIDREQNVQWVSDFLKSPEGAHLLEKIRKSRKS